MIVYAYGMELDAFDDAISDKIKRFPCFKVQPADVGVSGGKMSHERATLGQTTLGLGIGNQMVKGNMHCNWNIIRKLL